MKTLARPLILVLCALLPAAALAADPTLSDAERAELISLLEDSRQQFEALTARSTGDAWSQAPAEGKWSVGEVAEHLVVTEQGILAMAQGALASDADPEWEATTAMTVDQLVAMLGDRSQKFQAPETLQPTGEMSREEAIEQFAGVRARTLDFVRGTDAPLKAHTAEGPPGKMNAHMWLALIGAHNLRHNAQIEEAITMVAAANESPTAED